MDEDKLIEKRMGINSPVLDQLAAQWFVRLAKDESRRFARMNDEEDGRNYELVDETERRRREAIMERIRNRKHAAQVGVIEAEMSRHDALVTGTWNK